MLKIQYFDTMEDRLCRCRLAFCNIQLRSVIMTREQKKEGVFCVLSLMVVCEWTCVLGRGARWKLWRWKVQGCLLCALLDILCSVLKEIASATLPPSTSTPPHPASHFLPQTPPTASPFYRWRTRADSTKKREGAEWPRCARQNIRAPRWVPAPFLYACLIGQKQHAWLCSAG